MSVETVFRPGLKGVIVAESGICFIDGERGVLRYRGYDIKELAERSNFEETTYLLHHGELPTQEQWTPFVKELRSLRPLSDAELEFVRALSSRAEPMDALRTAISAAGAFDPEGDDDSEKANRRRALRIVAIIPTILAAYERCRRGLAPVPPDEALGHAANFLTMLTDEQPDEVSARVFELCLVLHADHGFNASTFAARVAASTLADLYSAITSAVATLKGPLHGGANLRVINMIEEIGSPERVRPYVEEKLAKKEKIWGLGHRVYRTKDPRARILESLIDDLAQARGESSLYKIGREVERVATERLAHKGVYTNVDFYSGIICQMLGVPKHLAPPLFALSRVGGWTAHVLEQLADNVLIRPRAQYAGHDARPYLPIEERKSA